MRVFLFSFFVLFASCSKENTGDFKVDVNEIKSVQTSVKMKMIEGGTYKAFIGRDEENIVKVKSFLLDETAVTNAEYLKFLKANPQWTRSKILKLYTDGSYLKSWKGDYQLPDNVSPNAPVTGISWFAAVAYAKSVGKRLPTIDEWEYAAAADETTKNATDKPEFTKYILDAYQQKQMYLKPVKQGKPNYYGLYDLYGVIWEWTEDFNSVMMTGDSRADKAENNNLFCAGASVTTKDLKNYASFARFAFRGSLDANFCIANLGFRCAKDIK